jgi:hypothetical protein
MGDGNPGIIGVRDTFTEEESMAARAEELVKKFGAKVQEATYLVGHIDEHLGSIRATVGS